MTRLLHPLPEGWEILGIKRTKFYELIADGSIKTVQIGRRRLVAHEELVRYAAELQGESSNPHRDALTAGAA